MRGCWGCTRGIPWGARGILGQVLEGTVGQQLRGLEGLVHRGCARAPPGPCARSPWPWPSCGGPRGQPGASAPSAQCYASSCASAGRRASTAPPAPRESLVCAALGRGGRPEEGRGVDKLHARLHLAELRGAGADGGCRAAFVADAVRGGWCLTGRFSGCVGTGPDSHLISRSVCPRTLYFQTPNSEPFPTLNWKLWLVVVCDMSSTFS